MFGCQTIPCSCSNLLRPIVVLKSDRLGTRDLTNEELMLIQFLESLKQLYFGMFSHSISSLENEYILGEELKSKEFD